MAGAASQAAGLRKSRAQDRGGRVRGTACRLPREPGDAGGEKRFLAQVAVRGVRVVGRSASRADHRIYLRSAFGTPRLSSPASKYSAGEKSNTEAMRLDGRDWSLLLDVIPESL